MKGLELSRAYFEEYGRDMLENFKEIESTLCAGLIGSGSECFGFDDEISRDHDFEPGFCIFLPGEDTVDRKTAFALERAYAKLPKTFEGFERAAISPVGGSRHGVIRINDFLTEKTGRADGKLTASDWLSLPEYSLAEVVNGEIYFDNLGEMTRVRKELSYFPEDIAKKKLAGKLLLMAQSGQYNYTRCLSHGERGAAQLAAIEFAKNAIGVIFILNGRYMPYYKWSFRALRALPLLSIEAELLEYLITTDNEPEQSEQKYDVIEGIAADIIDILRERNLSEAICGDLEKHAYSVNDSISDPEIRNAHILAAIRE